MVNCTLSTTLVALRTWTSFSIPSVVLFVSICLRERSIILILCALFIYFFYTYQYSDHPRVLIDCDQSPWVVSHIKQVCSILCLQMDVAWLSRIRRLIILINGRNFLARTRNEFCYAITFVDIRQQWNLAAYCYLRTSTSLDGYQCIASLVFHAHTTTYWWSSFAYGPCLADHHRVLYAFNYS